MPTLTSTQQAQIDLATQLLEPHRNAIRYCSACGTCTSNCPVYKLTRSEKDTGRGHIRMVEWWIAKLQTTQNWKELLNYGGQVRQGLACCLRCYNCHTACPSGLEIISTLEAARQSVNIISPERDLIGAGFRVYGRWFRVINSFLLTLVRVLTPLMMQFNRSRFVGLNFLSGLIYLAKTRPKSKPSSSTLAFSKGNKCKIAYFHDCMSGLMHPKLKQIAKRELEILGYKVEILPNTICCGAPFVAKGDFAALKAHTVHNHKILEQVSQKYDYIVFSNPTCAKTVLKIYPQILQHELDYQKKITMDWRLIIGSNQINGKSELSTPPKISYHDACHLRNFSNEGDSMRALCQKCGSYQSRLGEQDCCGFGGVFNFQYSQLARQLNDKRVSTIPDDTEILVNANPACTMFLAVGLTSRISELQNPPPVLHPVELWALHSPNRPV